MGIFDELKKLVGLGPKQSQSTEGEEWSDVSELSEQIRRRNAERAKQVGRQREPPNPVQPVEDPRHEKYAEKYAWFRSSERAAKYLLGTDWDEDDIEQLVAWATYAYTDEDVAAVIERLGELDSSPSFLLDRRLAAAWLIARRFSPDDLPPGARRKIEDVLRANPRSKLVPVIASEMGAEPKDLYDLSNFTPELLSFPDEIRGSDKLREQAVERALADDGGLHAEQYWALGQAFVDRLADVVIERELEPSRFVIDTVARSSRDDRFGVLLEFFLIGESRDRAESHLLKFPGETLNAAVEFLGEDSRKKRRIGLHLLRLATEVNAELLADVSERLSTLAANTDDVRVRVQLHALPSAS